MDESDMDTRVEEFVNRFSTLLIAHDLLVPIDYDVLLLNKLQGLVTNLKWSSTDVIELFNALLQRFESTKSNDRTSLLSWLLEMLHGIEINYITPSWEWQEQEAEQEHTEQKTKKTLIQLIRDKTVTNENMKTCLADDREKKLDEILEEIREQKLNQVDENLLGEVKHIVSSVNEALNSNSDGSQWSGLKKDLLKLCRAVKDTQSLTPRLTQMVSWCIMALSEEGRLVQVGTGEGKSCIVAMFAAFQAMTGKKVHILTSSSVLAERDMKEWRKFYKDLNISVDCNTNKQDKDMLKECYKCQVVYGTAYEFAGHWLLHHFERMDIFGQRTFQCAIVDEVDSLMLDKGHHMVYLSSDMPALQHLNRLLALIWDTANQYSTVGTQTSVGRKYSFLHVVLEKITKSNSVDEFTILQIAEDTGTLAKGSVTVLRKNLSLLPKKTANITPNQLAAFFKTIQRRFPSCQFALYCINIEGTVEELNKEPQNKTADRKRVPLLLTSGGFCQYMYADQDSVLTAAEEEIKHVLHFTPCDMSQDKGHCYIPGFLSDLVKSKLKVWIENAFYAQTMTMDHEYIKERHGLVPVDYSCTGVVENFRVWTDGLHQFLEMKHMFKLSDMTAITNYMSNVGLLQKYGNQIFGISGTLGQQAETETLQKIYEGITTCQIPSFKRRKLFEVEGVFADDEKEWIEKICDVVTEQTSPTIYRAQRSVLVICETIKRAKDLHQVLGDKVPNKKLYISNNMDNTAIFAKKLDGGEVIIATNLAGRGTDLKISDEVNRAGGLFVVQTFLPKNARVEAQAFGRTARQGSPGSAQLIVCSSHLPDSFVRQLKLFQKSHKDEQTETMSSTLSHILTKNSESGITTVKKIRDNSVAEELASYLKCEIPKIRKKEELFSQYLDVQDEVYRNSNNKPADSYLSALNEFWGMWLLTDFNENDSIMDFKNRLTEDLETARKKLEQRESPLSNLHHYIAFGNELREKRHLAESIKMYTKAIQEDPCWAAIAYYNRACTSLIQQDGNQDPNCINQALEDLQNALKSVELYCEQIKATHRYARQQVEDLLSDAITRFDSHMNVRYKVLLRFKANINEAMKKVDRARDIGGNVKMTEILVYFLLPLENFLPLAVLTTQSLPHIRSRDPLKMHQLISHPYFDIINEISCLNSLGLTHVYSLDTRFSLGGFFSKAARRIRNLFD